MDWRSLIERIAPRKRSPTLIERFDRAADSGWLWVLAAVVLWATGRRFARRAGLRGLVNGALAWVVTTVLGRFVGKDLRPPATAAAFTAGVALESPIAGAVTAATATPSFRGATPSDAYGAALGVGLAVATSRVWPMPPDEGPRVPKVFLPDRLEPSTDGDGLFIAVNSGAGDGDSPTDQLKECLPQAKVAEIEIVEGDELRKALDDAAEHSIALGICGGDGSINTATQVAMDHEKPLAVFPAGTLNHLTGALGIETIDEAVEAVKDGEAVGVDVATIDNHVFVNTASFGAYVELVDMREKLEKRLGKWPAVLIALIRVLRQSDPVCVEIEGRERKVWMAFIGNCRYSPSGFAPSWRKQLDDGQIDFRFVDGSAPWARLRLVAAVLTGRLGRSKVYKQLVCDELRIKSLEGPLRLARDGETFEASSDEVVVRKLSKRLALYCPHDNVA